MTTFASVSANAQGIVCGLQAPFPDTWNPPAGPPPAWIPLAKERAERIRAIRNKLGAEFNVKFDRTPWRQSLAQLAADADITIRVDEALWAEKPAESDVPATISTTASLREILHTLLEANDLMFAVHEWGLEVTTAGRATNQSLTCMLDTSTLLPGPSNSNELVTAITQHIDPDNWIAAGGTSHVSLLGSMLILTATDSTIAKVEHFCSQVARQEMRNLSFTPPAILTPAATEKSPVASRVPQPPLPPIPWDTSSNHQPNWLQSGNGRQQRIEAVRNKLSSQVTASIKNVTWREGLKQLASKADIELRLNEIQLGNVDDGMPISIEATASLRKIIEEVLADKGLSWIVREGFVEIATSQDTNGKLCTQTIDMSLFLPDAWNSTLLLESIPMHINPDEWLKSGGQSANTILGSLMVTTATDATLAKIEEFCVQVAEQPKRNLSSEFDPARRSDKP